MNSEKSLDLFRIIRLGVAIDEIDDSILSARINELNEFKQTLLHEAIAFKQEGYALFLIKKGVNVNQQDYNGATALHFAVVYMYPTVIKLLLKYGADPNIVDMHGNGALWTAVFNARGEYDIIKELKATGANPNAKNKYGKSPLDFARQIKDDVLVEILTG